MFVVLIFLLKFSIAWPIISTPINSTDCTPVESIIEIGLCTQHLKELSILHNDNTLQERYFPVPLEFAKNVTSVCRKIDNCFQRSNCSDVHRVGDSYRQKCATIEFRYYNLNSCVSKFFQEVYLNQTDCVKEQDWFSDDIQLKTSAYQGGKQCVLDFAKRNCTTNQIAYLESSYDNLIYLLTTNTSEAYSVILGTENDPYLSLIFPHANYYACNSLHDQLVGRQCEPVYMEHLRELEKWKKGEGSSESDEKMEGVCRKVMNCAEKYCVFNHNLMRYGIGTSCKPSTINNSTALPYPTSPPAVHHDSKTFNDCYAQIATKSVASNYACVQKRKLLSQVNFMSALLAFNGYSQTYYLSGVLNNKHCVRTFMNAECSPSALENFEKDWNRIRRDTVAMKRKLRDAYGS